MTTGTQDLIDELREYAAPRKGELAGMLLEAANRLQERTWITDRDPTPEECEAVEATGFIICLSGTLDNVTYDHAIDMQDNWYEDERWYLHGAHPNKTKGLQGDEHEVFKVHGWMLPPSWDIEED
jgi:hypothetical protein